MLEIADLSVRKGGKTVCSVPHLRVELGERVVISGENGSGKSTLLRTIGGLERDILGAVATSLPKRERIYVHQSPYLFSGSVMANATYGLAARGLPRRQRREAARRWLERMGVAHLAARSTARLSGGERRRVALARAFATEARMLLLDEPFADFDDSGAECIRMALAAMTDVTMLIASPIAVPEWLEVTQTVLLAGGEGVRS